MSLEQKSDLIEEFLDEYMILMRAHTRGSDRFKFIKSIISDHPSI